MGHPFWGCTMLPSMAQRIEDRFHPGGEGAGSGFQILLGEVGWRQLRVTWLAVKVQLVREGIWPAPPRFGPAIEGLGVELCRIGVTSRGDSCRRRGRHRGGSGGTSRLWDSLDGATLARCPRLAGSCPSGLADVAVSEHAATGRQRQAAARWGGVGCLLPYIPLFRRCRGRSRWQGSFLQHGATPAMPGQLVFRLAALRPGLSNQFAK